MNFTYSIDNGCLVRNVQIDEKNTARSTICPGDIGQNQPFNTIENYEKIWLQCKRKPISSEKNGEVRIADLFSGCGGLSLGIAEACRALEYKFVPVLAADLAPSALELYKKNFHPLHTIEEPIEMWVDSDIGQSPSQKEQQFIDMLGEIDILIGGPPCQGNSDLNNHTRRADPRNLLYLRMIRCVELLNPKCVLIENVPGVRHDTHNVVDIAINRLRELGYSVDFGTIDMSIIGVPQKRKRFFLIASRIQKVSFERCIERVCTETRPLSWALNDLLDAEDQSVFNSPAKSSDTNRRRIDYLFDHDLYDLPNSERPDCHRLKNHSYTAVYGRMYWDKPAPTITGGFGSNGQGRFVHPLRRRTLTPHEAARLQFFPDYFDFGNVKRRELQQIIGNAVPSKAGYAIGLEFLINSEVEI